MRLLERSGQSRPYSCREARAALPRLLDGELDAASHERLRSHLATCAKCASEADSQNRLAGALRAPWPAEQDTQLPSGAALLHRVRHPQPAARTRLRLLPSAAWAAAATLALVIAGSQLQHHSGPAPAHPAASSVIAPPLPSLFVLDDEREGRRVILGSADAPGVRRVDN